MNGNILFLSASEDDPGGRSFVWNTEINLLDVDSITAGSDHRIVISGKENYMGDDGMVKVRRVQYQIVYGFVKGKLNSKIQVKRAS